MNLTNLITTMCNIYTTSFYCLDLLPRSGVSLLNVSLVTYSSSLTIINSVRTTVIVNLNHSDLVVGEFESTITMSFLRASNLRHWLSRSNCPDVVHSCKEYFDKVFSPQSDMDKQTSLISTSPKEVPSDLCLLIGRCKTTLQAHVHYDGVTYSRSSTHIGNSLIRFYSKGNFRTTPIPGCIKYIYHEGDSIRLAVQHQLPLPQDEEDPFQLYAHFLAKLYSSILSDDLEAVRLSWIVGHYARWNMSSGHSVILSLRRVSISFNLICNCV